MADADNMRLMREGVVLTAEINQLRRELKVAKAMRSNRNPGGNPKAPQSDESMAPSPPPGGPARNGGRAGMIGSRDSQREFDMQTQQIHRLRAHIARIEDNLGGPQGNNPPKFDRSQYVGAAN